MSPKRSPRIGRFERRIVLAIAIAASMPLAGALVFGRQALQEAYEVGVNPRVAAELEASLESERIRLGALRSAAERTTTAIANDHLLNQALLAADDATVRDRLGALTTLYPEVVRIGIDHGRVVETSIGEDVRELELTEPLASGGRVSVTHTTPAEPFRAYLRAGETAEVYRLLDARATYLSTFFLLTYLVLVLSVIVVALGVSTLMARRITRRVLGLATATERVGQGDLSIEVAVEGDDEVAELTRAFNTMVRDVRSSRDRIDYLERVGAWQEMAKRLAHEIKNPLTPIQLAMQEVHKAYRGDDARFAKKLEDAREMVEEEIRTLRRLVHDFSEFARLPTPILEPAELGAFVREQGKSLEPESLRTVERPSPLAAPELLLEVGDGPLPVSIDAPMLRRVVDNLVRNAVHAIDDSKPERRGRIVLRARREGSECLLEVEDDGPGVVPAERARVFQPYVTSKAEGTGLGLAIVKKVVLEHGGSIECTQGELGGARFVVRLPLGAPGRKDPR